VAEGEVNLGISDPHRSERGGKAKMNDLRRIYWGIRLKRVKRRALRKKKPAW